MQHKLTFTSQELQMIVMAFHTLTIKGTEVRQVGLLLDKIQTELEKKAPQPSLTDVAENLKP